MTLDKQGFLGDGESPNSRTRNSFGTACGLLAQKPQSMLGGSSKPKQFKKAIRFMKKADLITGSILLVLSGNVILSAWRMPPSGSTAPGSGFFPLCLGILLAVLSIVLLIKAVRHLSDQSSLSILPTGKGFLSVSAVVLGLVLYIVLMETIGFVLNTFIFVSYLMKIVERENWKMTMIVAVLTTTGLYVVFHVLLGIILPRNQLGF